MGNIYNVSRFIFRNLLSQDENMKNEDNICNIEIKRKTQKTPEKIEANPQKHEIPQKTRKTETKA
mgnify:FL=1